MTEDIENRIDELEEKLDQIMEKQEELETEVNINSSRLDHISEFTDEMKDDIDQIVKREDDGSPIEKLAGDYTWENMPFRESKNKRIALALFKNWKSIRTRPTSDYIVKVTELDKFLPIKYDQNKYRVAEELENLSNGKFYVTETNSGKIIVQNESKDIEWRHEDDD